MKEILPDSRLSDSKGVIQSKMGNWVPIFCANCGKEGGAVPEEGTTFIFWLCDCCATTCGEIAGTWMMPDEIYYEKVKQAQLAKYGRCPTIEEIVVLLDDPNSLESLLAKSRVAMTPKAGR